MGLRPTHGNESHACEHCNEKCATSRKIGHLCLDPQRDFRESGARNLALIVEEEAQSEIPRSARNDTGAEGEIQVEHYLAGGLAIFFGAGLTASQRESPVNV